jgi:hypothetical protein
MIVPIGLSNAANATTDMIPACLQVIVLFLPLFDQMGIKWGDTPLALLFLSPISMFSCTFLIFNSCGAYYSETAAIESSTAK